MDDMENSYMGMIYQEKEKGYGIFHCEGDEAVLEDIVEFLDGKGIKINA